MFCDLAVSRAGSAQDSAVVVRDAQHSVSSTHPMELVSVSLLIGDIMVAPLQLIVVGCIDTPLSCSSG